MIDHLKYKLDEYGIIYDNVHFFNEHHLYHAANAFYSSNFDEAAALVLDGGGFTYNDYISLREIESMYYFSNIKCNTIKKHYSRSDIFFSDRPEKHKENVIFSSTLSCGGLFNSLSRSTALEAGKLMGLSSYGDEKNIETGSWFIYDQECEVWVTDNQKILNSLRNHSQNSQINPGPYGDNLPSQYQLVGDQYSQEKAISDIAKKLQIETKKHTVNLIRQVLDKCQTNNIVLSGGYMLNCVNNYEYIKEFPNVNFYIDPICHDGGTCIGAVKYLWHCILKNKSREPLKTLYLG
jgi:carbamoyltransferase